MAYARTATVRTTPRRSGTVRQRRSSTPSGVRWDRVGRVALLIVLFGVLVSYVGPARSYISTWQQSKEKQTQVSKLEAENAVLKQQRSRYQDPQTLQREARRLGMIKAGEQPYVISRTR